MTILFTFIYFLHIDVKNSTVVEMGKTQFVKTNILIDIIKEVKF
jgi:heme/copper-type cytochrome/quinol oxidase subunit 4